MKGNTVHFELRVLSSVRALFSTQVSDISVLSECLEIVIIIAKADSHTVQHLHPLRNQNMKSDHQQPKLT